MSFADLTLPIRITLMRMQGHAPRQARGCSPSRASPRGGGAHGQRHTGWEPGGLFQEEGGFSLFIGSACCRKRGVSRFIYFTGICASCRQGFFRKIFLLLPHHEYFSMIHLKEELIPLWLSRPGFSNRKVEAEREPGILL